MADKTSTVQTNYQGLGSNPGIWFSRDHSNIYSRGQGRGFNPTKPNVGEKCEALGSDVYFIRDARQSDKYKKKLRKVYQTTSKVIPTKLRM